MNVLCLFQTFSFEASTIYLDLVRELVKRGHRVFVLAGTSDFNLPSGIVNRDGAEAVYVKLADQFKTDKIRKGIIQLTMGTKFIAAAKANIWKEQVDLIIYPTPPVTLGGVVRKLKKHYKAKSYLMLKDIFPQNAVDLKMMKENGIVYKYFRHLEKQLYDVSDVIGCMSQANIDYVKNHNPGLDTGKLELFPNTVAIKEKKEKPPGEEGIVTFMFGGNLGRPQAVDFLLLCIDRMRGYMKAKFVIIGTGTEADKVKAFVEEKKPANLEYREMLPRDEYEKQLDKADVGLVVLSPDFSIPNYPSRILSYMQMGKPILAVTDTVTDIHALVTYEARCGWWCPSDDPTSFIETIEKICDEADSLKELGNNGREYLEKNFNVTRSVEILEKAMEV
ncbi:MAG: glycosyltransferase family 4 protein [Lachnospiraceae bacterium]|nr:glycosyltransferase family 4 protein [Lachnospiraceae bacterium]